MGVLVFKHIMRMFISQCLSLTMALWCILIMRSTPLSRCTSPYRHITNIHYIRTNPLWFCMEAVERMNIYAVATFSILNNIFRRHFLYFISKISYFIELFILLTQLIYCLNIIRAHMRTYNLNISLQYKLVSSVVLCKP